MPRDNTVVFIETPEGLPADARRAKWFKLFLKVKERPGVEAIVQQWTGENDVKMNNATWQRKVLRDRASDYLPPGQWKIRAECLLNRSILYVTYMGESEIPVVLDGSRGPKRSVQDA